MTATDPIARTIAEQVADVLEERGVFEQKPQVEKRLYTVDEAGEALRLPASSIRRLVKEGKLPKHPHLGTNIRIPVEAVRRFAEVRG